MAWQNDDPTFVYTREGTYFLIKYADRYFAITAKHVLDCLHQDPSRIRILDSKVTGHFVPIWKLTRLKATDPNDSDYGDLGTLTEARVVIEDFRCEYNHDRPHSKLGYMSPNRFAAQFWLWALHHKQGQTSFQSEDGWFSG